MIGSMNALDIFIISGIALSIIYSFFRGIIKEVFSVLAIVIGLVVAARTYPLLVRPINELVHNSRLAGILGFLAIFFLLSFSISLIGKNVRKLLKIMFLGWIDRLGGAIFGLVKGIVVACVIIMLLVAFFPPDTPFLRTSKATPFIISFSTFLIHLIPVELKSTFHHKRKQLLDFWQKKYFRNQYGKDKTFGQKGPPDNIQDLKEYEKNRNHSVPSTPPP